MYTPINGRKRGERERTALMRKQEESGDQEQEEELGTRLLHKKKNNVPELE